MYVNVIYMMLLKDEDEGTPYLFSSVCQMYNVVNKFLKYPPSHNHYGDFNNVIFKLRNFRT